MDPLVYGNDGRKDEYRTREDAGKGRKPLWPSLVFHGKMLKIYWRASRQAVNGFYDGEQWALSSLEVFRLLESVGVRFAIDNLDVPYSVTGPCVYVGNHMSTLETMVLPCLLQPACNTTFIVKESLTRFPVFGHVMRSRDPISVGREDPREDLRAVLEGGQERLESGTSVIVFPQTTRSSTFDPAQFNTIGVKLARRANAPIVPIALKTDAWEKGSIVKDFGPIRPDREVHISFGEPLEVSGSGREEHEQIVRFIQEKLEEWGEGQSNVQSPKSKV
jgi:1-acyl-sn-glycerol-3-phosphate acyltransferase